MIAHRSRRRQAVAEHQPSIQHVLARSLQRNGIGIQEIDPRTRCFHAHACADDARAASEIQNARGVCQLGQMIQQQCRALIQTAAGK